MKMPGLLSDGLRRAPKIRENVPVDVGRLYHLYCGLSSWLCIMVEPKMASSAAPPLAMYLSSVAAMKTLNPRFDSALCYRQKSRRDDADRTKATCGTCPKTPDVMPDWDVLPQLKMSRREARAQRGGQVSSGPGLLIV